MASNTGNDNGEPEVLYHIKRTIIDYARDKSGATRIIDVLGTYIDLAAAKKGARSALISEGYLKDDFDVYEENNGSEDWKHGDGVIVWAKAPAGHEFQVQIDTKPNLTHLKGNASGEVEGNLQYVLQTIIYYNKDRVGGLQTTEVEGTYLTREEAINAAKTVLIDEEVKKESYAEYEERSAEQDDWPYDDNVWVHAVADTGENFIVSVVAQPHTHNQHDCKHHGNEKCDCSCKHTEEACKNKSCKHGDCESSSKTS